MTRAYGRLSRAAALIPIAAIALVLFDPIPQPAQSVVALVLMTAGVTFGAQVWFASRDDVVKEAARVASLWGVMLGVWIAIATVFVVRYAPAASNALARIADANANAPPSTVAFGLGVIFTLVCVLLASAGVWAGWWIRKR